LFKKIQKFIFHDSVTFVCKLFSKIILLKYVFYVENEVAILISFRRKSFSI